MSQDIKAMIRDYVDDVYSHGNMEHLDALLAIEYVNHTSLRTVRGVDGVKQFVTMLRRAFPDLRETIEEQIVEDNKEVHRWVIQGTHQGEFMGIPATGEKITIDGITITHITDGKIAEEWTQTDLLGLLQQLGAVPASIDDAR